MTIIAAADGSALGNPGPAGWAWYIDSQTWAAGGWAHGTNNMGELTAVLNLLESTRHVADQDLKILCDSQYVINSVTKWMRGWKKKGWKKSDGKPVLNVEIMKALDRELEGRDVRFEWVKGHAGHELNEAADERARAMAAAFQKRQDPSHMPVGPGFPNAGGALSAQPTTVAQSERQMAGSDKATVDQPDLFSELMPQDQEEHTLTRAPERDSARTWIRQELVVLTGLSVEVGPTGSEKDSASVLLHRDFECVGRNGAAGGLEILAHESEGLECGTQEAELSLSSVIPLGSTAYQLNYRLSERSAVTRRTSLWVREDQHNEMGPWLLRHHQVTAES